MPKSSKILLASLLLTLAFCVLIGIKAGSVLIQLFIALALAYILNPLVKKLEKKGLNRTVSVLVVFSLSLLIIGTSTILLIYTVKSELANVQLNIPGYAKKLYELVPKEVKVQLNIDTPEKITEQLTRLTQESRSMALDMIKPALAWLQKAVTSTVGFVLNLLGYLIIPVYLFYLLVDMPLLLGWLKGLPPERFREKLSILASEIDTVLAGFIRGQLLVCAILAVLYSIGLWLIGIDLAIAIGTLSGAAFIIPYVGTILGIVLSMSMALLKFHDLLHPMLCLSWFIFVQLLEGTFITPKVVGDTVGLHPLIAIFALLVGGQLLGISGMLLAIPLAAVIKVFAARLLEYYRSSEFYTGA